MKYTIRGDRMPVLEVELQASEKMFTESGGMAWKTPNVSMETSTRGGVMKGIARAFAGESMFLTTFTCDQGTGMVSFASEFPGTILPLEVKGSTILAQRDAFMAGTDGVDVSIAFQKKLGASLFGGEGFILQKLTGNGTVFLEIAGHLTEFDLTEGQVIEVDPGYVGAFEASVNYDIERVKGIKNIFLSGEGLFLARLEGPGKVWLQSMPMSNFAHRLMRYLPKK